MSRNSKHKKAEIFINPSSESSQSHDSNETDSDSNSLESSSSNDSVILFSNTEVTDSIYNKISTVKPFNLNVLKGDRGHRGPKGDKGSCGPEGPIGPRGMRGHRGPRGEGKRGPRGMEGCCGPTGMMGPTGNDGPTGMMGPTGNDGPTGIMGPTGNDGPTGMMGPTGNNGPTGIMGPSGILSFADFYALMPGDNTATIPIGGDIIFPNDGPFSGADITRLGPASFDLVNIGTYQVLFQVSIDEAAQLLLTLNNNEQAYTLVGRATGTSQLVGMVLINTVSINTVLTVRNPATSPGALTVTPNAGGPMAVSAHLIITRIK
jgi:hypothetical protein